MITDYTIFCVGCSSVVDKEKAERIFRTGFYKVSMRLGICTTCESRNGQLEEACMMERIVHSDSFTDVHVMYESIRSPS